MLLDVDKAKRIYNWFFFSFSHPTYKTNDLCQSKDIKLMKELEAFLIAQGE